MSFSGRQLTTRLDADGTLTVALADRTWEAPSGAKVLVRIEASPINPSDLGLLYAAADMANAQYTPGRIVARMPEGATRAFAKRHGIALPAGNEAAGTVVAAGEDPAAQALLGKRVACVPGAAYATYAECDAAMCMAVEDDVSAAQAASSFVNPMTALGFVETMKLDGFSGIVHVAAASNLGQMLVRICRDDNVPLVNVVRSPGQVALLEGLGATHVLDMTAPDYPARLADAIAATGAMLGFDPVGGGTISGQLLAGMEVAASRDTPFSRYGTDTRKKVYIYGGLDTGPTVLNRSFGLTWELGGWLLWPFMRRAGPEIAGRMRARVMRELTTTFASHYKAEVSLEGMLEKDAVLDYNARRTGEKYLVVP